MKMMRSNASTLLLTGIVNFKPFLEYASFEIQSEPACLDAFNLHRLTLFSYKMSLRNTCCNSSGFSIEHFLELSKWKTNFIKRLQVFYDFLLRSGLHSKLHLWSKEKGEFNDVNSWVSALHRDT